MKNLMKKIVLVSLVFLIFTSLYSKAEKYFVDIQFGENWKIHMYNMHKGVIRKLLKRKPIVDKNKVKVIPNAIVKLYQYSDINSKLKESEDYFEYILKINNGLKFLEKAKKEGRGEVDTILNSKSFIDQYVDPHGQEHIVFYVVSKHKEKMYVFLLVDTTRSIYPQIKGEISKILMKVFMTKPEILTLEIGKKIKGYKK